MLSKVFCLRLLINKSVTESPNQATGTSISTCNHFRQCPLWKSETASRNVALSCESQGNLFLVPGWAGKCLITGSFRGKKKKRSKSLICSDCQLLWCKLHHVDFKPILEKILKTLPLISQLRARASSSRLLSGLEAWPHENPTEKAQGFAF